MTTHEFIERLARWSSSLADTAPASLWMQMRDECVSSTRAFLAECGEWQCWTDAPGTAPRHHVFVLKGGEADGAAGGPYHGEAVRPDVATGSAEAQEIRPQLEQSADAAEPAHHDGSAGPQNSARTEPAGPNIDQGDLGRWMYAALADLARRLEALESAQVSGGVAAPGSSPEDAVIGRGGIGKSAEETPLEPGGESGPEPERMTLWRPKYPSGKDIWKEWRHEYTPEAGQYRILNVVPAAAYDRAVLNMRGHARMIDRLMRERERERSAPLVCPECGPVAEWDGWGCCVKGPQHPRSGGAR